MKAHGSPSCPATASARKWSRKGCACSRPRAQHSLGIEWREFGCNCDYYAKHGRMMPEDWF